MKNNKTAFAMLISVLLVTFSGFSVGAQTLKCVPLNPPPADHGYSSEFFHTTVEMAKSMTVKMNIGELDVFGSCGKANIGMFDTDRDQFSEDAQTGAVSFAREFLSPVHDGVMMWEKMTIKTLSESNTAAGKKQMTVNIKYDHSCQKYIDYDMDLNCLEP